jgi:RecA-family ATPase
MNAYLWSKIDPHIIGDDFLIEGFPFSSVGSIIAPGGTGKSYLALELAMAVAVDSPFADLAGFKPFSHGAVLYINAGDTYFQLTKRLAFLGQRLPPEVRGQLVNLDVIKASGSLMDLSIKPELGLSGTHLEALIASGMNYHLIILDTMNRFHRGLNENDNGQMSELVSNLEYLAEITGAAVLFLHHTNKTAIRDGNGESQAASRGASCLVDNVRYSAYLTKMTVEEAPRYGIAPERHGFYVRFGIAKQNYSLPQTPRWFERREGGVLVPVELSKTTSKTNPTSTNNNSRSYHDNVEKL